MSNVGSLKVSLYKCKYILNTIKSVIQNVKLQHVLADVYGKEAIFGLLWRIKKKEYISREEKNIK